VTEANVPTLEVLRNPLRAEVPDRPSLTGGLPSHFHRRLPDYAETPLIDLPGLAAKLGVSRLMVKDESSRFGLPAFKMLGASWASYRALNGQLVEGAGREIAFESVTQLAERLEPLLPLALATATDGNHGRAVARFAAWVGLGARIFVPDGTSPARIAAIESEGASCTVVDGSYEDAVTRAAQEAGHDCLVISDTSWPGYETVPLWVIEGYATIFDEIDLALAATRRPDPTLVVVPIGVGALAAAVAQNYRRPLPPSETGRQNRRNPKAKMPILVGVEPDSANCVMASARAGHLVEVPGPHRSVMAGLNCGMASPVAWPWVSAGFDWFVAGGDDLATTGMRRLANHGVVSGESGAATVGALEALAAGAGAEAGLTLTSDDVVLVLSTEGATDPEFYQATVGRPAHQVAHFAANH
jgi:diaminopropionate ammonia-lyase